MRSFAVTGVVRDDTHQDLIVALEVSRSLLVTLSTPSINRGQSMTVLFSSEGNFPINHQTCYLEIGQGGRQIRTNWAIFLIATLALAATKVLWDVLPWILKK